MIIKYDIINNVSIVKRIQLNYGIFKYDMVDNLEFDVNLFVTTVISKTKNLKNVSVFKTNLDPSELVSLTSFKSEKTPLLTEQYSYYVFVAYSSRQNFEVDESNKIVKPLYFILSYSDTLKVVPQIFSSHLGMEYIYQLGILLETLSQQNNSHVINIWSNKIISNNTDTQFVGNKDSLLDIEDEYTKLGVEKSTLRHLINEALKMPGYKELFEYIDSNDDARLMVDIIYSKYKAYYILKNSISEDSEKVSSPFSESSGIQLDIKANELDQKSKSIISDEELSNDIPLQPSNIQKNVSIYLNKLFEDKKAYLDNDLINYVFDPANKQEIISFLQDKVNNKDINFRAYNSLSKFLVYFFEIKKNTMSPSKSNAFFTEIYDYLPNNVQKQYSKYKN